MNKFMLMVTVATAAVLGASQSRAETIYYNPNTPPTTVVVPATPTAVVIPADANATIYYTPPGAVLDRPLTLGQMIAYRIDDSDLSEFKAALQSAVITGTFKPEKGYTVFAPVNSAYDGEPVEHYIVNDRIGLSVMGGTSNWVKAINGDTVRLNKVHTGYFVDNDRVTGAIKSPEGTIYKIGGPVTTYRVD